MKKIISLIIILFSIFIGCEKDSKIEEVKNSYIIGIDDADYPFEYRDPITGKLTGFEYELISEIAKEGDFEIKIVIIPFANLIPELAKNTIDIGIGHFSITDERKKLVNFSNSYLSSNEVVLANKNNTSTNEDAPIYAEPPGTTFLDYAKKIPNAKIVEEVKYDKIIEKLLQKEIDYTIIDEPTATVYSSMHSELYIKENIQRTYIGLALSKKLSKEDTNGINQLEELLNKTKKLLDTSKDADQLFKLFSEFNDILYNLSKYQKVVSLIKNINMYLRIFRKYSIDNEERRLKAYNDHVGIVEALKDWDLEKALNLNNLHLSNSKDFIIKNLKK